MTTNVKQQAGNMSIEYAIAARFNQPAKTNYSKFGSVL